MHSNRLPWRIRKTAYTGTDSVNAVRQSRRQVEPGGPSFRRASLATGTEAESGIHRTKSRKARSNGAKRGTNFHYPPGPEHTDIAGPRQD